MSNSCHGVFLLYVDLSTEHSLKTMPQSLPQLLPLPRGPSRCLLTRYSCMDLHGKCHLQEMVQRGDAEVGLERRPGRLPGTTKTRRRVAREREKEKM